MMKKLLCLAVCLCPSAFAAVGGVCSTAPVSATAAVFLADEGEEGQPEATTPTATWEDETNKVLKVTVSAAGQFATCVSSLSDDQKAATRVNIIGTGVTLSDDDLAAAKNFTALKLLDLSGVEKCADYTKIGLRQENNQNVKISLIIPAAENTTAEDGTVTYADQVANVRNLQNATNNFTNVYSFHQNESGSMDCYALVLSTAEADIDFASVVSGKCANLILVSSSNEWAWGNNTNSSWNYFIAEVNKVTGVDNLVLSNMANCTSVDVSGITNSSLKRLILPDNYSKQNWKLADITFGEGCGIGVVQYLKQETVWSGSTSTTYNNFLTHVLKAGGLAAIKDSHYYQTNLSEAYSVIFSGNVNEADFAFFNGVKNNRLNLASLTHTTTDEDGNTTTIDLTNAISDLSNQYVEYLTLPDGVRYPTDPTFANLFTEKNPLLKAVGLYVEETSGEGEEAKTKKSAVFSSNAQLGAYYVEAMLGTSRLTYINKIQFSGIVCATDLACGDIYVDANNHLAVNLNATGSKENGTYVREFEFDETSGKAVTGNLANAQTLTEVDLSNVRLWDANNAPAADVQKAAQNDLCLKMLGTVWNGDGGRLTTVLLPTDKSVYRLPNTALQSQAKITELLIPENYTEIGSGALGGAAVPYVYTSYTNSEGKLIYRVGGKDYEEMPDLTNLDKTCTLPINLTRVEVNAFALDECWTDVYVNYYVDANGEKKAPYCERNSFSSGTLQGWGGFNNVHPIQRSCFTNSSSKIAILHYPSGLKRSLVSYYTDLTRNYSLADETGATDGNGNLIIWPTQYEWYRAFRQGTTGYIWNDWDLYKSDGTTLAGSNTNLQARSRSLDFLSTDGTTVTGTATEYGLTLDKVKNLFHDFAPKETAEGATNILEEADTWIGWHQFVLTAAVDYTNDDPKWHTYTSDDNWWTICLPFNMTAAEIEKTWGEGTKLCTLTGVVRNATNNTITLKFGEDLVAKAKKDSSTDNVLVWRMPYMIKPGKLESLKDESGEQTGPVFKLSESQSATLTKASGLLTTYKDKTVAEIRKALQDASETDCAVVVTAKDENGNDVKTGEGSDAADYQYIFLGQYTKYYVPTYGYFLGWDSKANNVNYFYQTVKPKVMNWNAYTCTIFHEDPAKVQWSMDVSTGTEATGGHWKFNSTTDDRAAIEDKMPGTSQTSGENNAKIAMFFGADETTSIEGISANGSVKTIPAGTVYNLGGQVVSTTGAAGLPKGIYITNGKKFVVK